MKSYTIGKVATETRVTRRAIRLYEMRGLIGEPARTATGYRLYTEYDVDLIRFIRRARDLGLSLDAVAEIIEISQHGAPCARTRALLDERIAEIDATIDDLQRLRATISAARQIDAHQSPATRCGLIESGAQLNDHSASPNERLGCHP